MITHTANRIFQEVIEIYHDQDALEPVLDNPYDKQIDALEHLLHKKCLIDTIQWHYEDLIRDPDIEPAEALKLKRKIDASNQERTDMVEYIDAHFLHKYSDVEPGDNATLNTESPAWAIDRLSILALKIYHMREESNRDDASKVHRQECEKKLGVLLEQRDDLTAAIDTLVRDIEEGRKYMKVYKQMKMYNDAELNPILRGQKSKQN